MLLLDAKPSSRLVLTGAVCVAALIAPARWAAGNDGMTVLGKVEPVPATSPTAQQIADLTPSAPRFGPTEAGKRSRDRIIVTVADASGAPVLGARWRFKTDDRSGWVYPAKGTTGEDGRISVTWVAGTPGVGVLTLTVENAVSSMTTELATESVVSQRPPDGATAVWLDHGGRANGYSIDLTPLSEPTGTYYAAIQWDGGYTGLQRGGSRYDYQLQFSVWDAPGGGDAQVVERGDGVMCRPFGGEGTGQACELNYPWRVGVTYRFEVTVEDLNGGSAMTLHVTDLAAGRRRFVGTLRYAARANLRSFAMFVEDFVHRAPTCLAKDVRSAVIRRAMARVGDSWQSITSGTLGHYREDSKNPGTPACANRAARHHVAGLEMVIGGRTASDPEAPRAVTIPTWGGQSLDRRHVLANAASLAPGVAPGSIASLFGESMVPETISAGVRIEIIDAAEAARTARLLYVSPEQIHFLVPAEVATGEALLRLAREGEEPSEWAFTISAVAPGLFSANGTSEGIGVVSALRVAADGLRSNPAVFRYDEAAKRMIGVPLDLGAEGDQVFLTLFGTGIRGAEGVRTTIGGRDVAVLFAGAQDGWAGLDQVEIGPLPRSLAGMGEVDVAITAAGITSNTVTIVVE